MSQNGYSTCEFSIDSSGTPGAQQVKIKVSSIGFDCLFAHFLVRTHDERNFVTIDKDFNVKMQRNIKQLKFLESKERSISV